jgi:hypothetical protein
LPEIGKRRERVLGGCGFSDSALSVKGDLPQFGHD